MSSHSVNFSLVDSAPWEPFYQTEVKQSRGQKHPNVWREKTSKLQNQKQYKSQLEEHTSSTFLLKPRSSKVWICVKACVLLQVLSLTWKKKKFGVWREREERDSRDHWLLLASTQDTTPGWSVRDQTLFTTAGTSQKHADTWKWFPSTAQSHVTCVNAVNTARRYKCKTRVRHSAVCHVSVRFRRENNFL